MLLYFILVIILLYIQKLKRKIKIFRINLQYNNLTLTLIITSKYYI